MIQNSRTLGSTLVMVALVAALGAGRAMAQDDKPDATPAPEPAVAEPPPVPQETAKPEVEPVDRLRFRADISNWIAQPAGLEFEPVSVIDPIDPFGTTVDDIDFGTASSARYALDIEFPGGHGGLRGSLWSTNSDGEITESLPGSFVFGELLAVPHLAGFANDGLADGYTSTFSTELRELRIDFVHSAFDSSRIHGRWLVGYREVEHNRVITADYFAFEPLLPPLFPPLLPDPRPDLDPLADSAVVSSHFGGRGVEGGLELSIPLLGTDRLVIEGGFAVAALRGDLDSAYRSTNAFYVETDVLGNRTILDPPYDNFPQILTSPPPTPVITQEVTRVGIEKHSQSTNASVIEAELGLRWRFWKSFGLFGGFRSTRYDNVGADVRVGVPSGTNFQGVTEQNRSVYYEGFFFGLSLGF
jgi:hypothetical protein